MAWAIPELTTEVSKEEETPSPAGKRKRKAAPKRATHKVSFAVTTD